MSEVHTITGQTGRVTITAEQVAAGASVHITNCTDAEVELVSVDATKVSITNCTKTTIKLPIGVKLSTGTVEVAGCTGVEVKAGIKIETTSINSSTGTAITFNTPEQLGRIGHTGVDAISVSFLAAPEYNVDVAEPKLIELAALAAATEAASGKADVSFSPDVTATIFVTRFADDEVVTEEAGTLAAFEAAAANAARPISAATAAEKREMLINAKKALGDKKPEGNEHVITGKTKETVVLAAGDLPSKPVLIFKENEDCTLDLSSTTTIIKLLVNGCKRCTILLPADCKLITSVVEVWDCVDLTITAAVKIGTLQVDISKNITVVFANTGLLGQVVSGGVVGMKVQFADDASQNVDLTQAKLEEIAPGIQLPADQTTQFTTRLINDNVLTEEIIRLANDYPTTQREKEAHDAELAAKDAALTAMAEKMLGTDSALSAEAKQELAAKVKTTSEKMGYELEAESGNAARVEYKKRQGTEMFKAKDFQQAAVHYTEAINIDPNIPAIWANRSMCWLKLAQADKALVDADACLALDSKYTKAHFRRGVALLELDRYEDACKSFRATLDLDPKNAQAKSSMMLAEKKLMMSRK